MTKKAKYNFYSEEDSWFRKRDYVSIWLVKGVTYTVLLTFFTMLLIILVEASDVMNWQFITDVPKENMTAGGIAPAIIGTISVTLLMILFAAPIGVAAAIYINEFESDSFWKRLILMAVNNLAGVPSIVIGLFGLGFFVLFIGHEIDAVMEYGLLFGKPALIWAAATLAVLVLPTIIVNTIESLRMIPQDQRIASFALGATRWQTISRVVIPQARSGILTGIILAVSRGVGETAPILFLGCAFFLPEIPLAALDLGIFSVPIINPAEQFMNLAYHIFTLSTQSANPALVRPIQFGTTLVLLIIVMMLNFVAVLFRYKFRKILDELKQSS